MGPSALDHGEPPTNLDHQLTIHRSEPFKPPAFSTWQATEKDNSKQYRQLRRKHMPRNEIETFDIVEGKVPVNVIANKGRLSKNGWALSSTQVWFIPIRHQNIESFTLVLFSLVSKKGTPEQNGKMPFYTRCPSLHSIGHFVYPIYPFIHLYPINF